MRAQKAVESTLTIRIMGLTDGEGGAPKWWKIVKKKASPTQELDELFAKKPWGLDEVFTTAPTIKPAAGARQPPSQWTLLGLAVHLGKIDAVQWALDHRASVDKRFEVTWHKTTFLHGAIGKTSGMQTPLFWAVVKQQRDIVELLLQH